MNRNKKEPSNKGVPKQSPSLLNMALVIRQGQITQNNKKCLPRRFICGFKGSPSLQDKKRREKQTPKIKVFTKHFEKKKFASGLFGFRHAGHALLAKTDQ